MTYIPAETRYDTMAYRRCGKSGILRRGDKSMAHRETQG